MSCFFFFNDTATTEIYTLSLHDALPIFLAPARGQIAPDERHAGQRHDQPYDDVRSEEHTSELQSHLNLVCRLLLEKKKYALPYEKSEPTHRSGRESCACVRSQ